MAMAQTCPECGLTDALFSHHGKCTSPWHADAHLRRKPTLEIGPDTLRKAADVHNATTIRMRAETSRRCFEDMLTFFVKKYAPEEPYERDNFQRDLMMLFRDAMEHKSMVFGLHMERTDSTLHALSMHATASLQAIYRPPLKEKP